MDRSRKWKCRTCNCDHSHFPGKIFRNLPVPKRPITKKKAVVAKESEESQVLVVGGSKIYALYRQVVKAVIRLCQGTALIGVLLLFLYLNFGPVHR